MQSVTQPTNHRPSLTESQKLHLPIDELTAQKEAARIAWDEAYEAWKSEPTALHLAKLEFAANEFQTINKKFLSVTMIGKHNAGTVRADPSEVLHV